jgi:hypothetical protein
MQKISAVYFIDAGGKAVKIGMVENASRAPSRINTLQTGNHEKLSLIGLIRFVERSNEGHSARIVEQELHIALDEYRLAGEWFRWSPELITIIEVYSDSLPDGLKPVPNSESVIPAFLDKATFQIESRQLVFEDHGE